MELTLKVQGLILGGGGWSRLYSQKQLRGLGQGILLSFWEGPPCKMIPFHVYVNTEPLHTPIMASLCFHCLSGEHKVLVETW